MRLRVCTYACARVWLANRALTCAAALPCDVTRDQGGKCWETDAFQKPPHHLQRHLELLKFLEVLEFLEVLDLLDLLE